MTHSFQSHVNLDSLQMHTTIKPPSQSYDTNRSRRHELCVRGWSHVIMQRARWLASEKNHTSFTKSSFHPCEDTLLSGTCSLVINWRTIRVLHGSLKTHLLICSFLPVEWLLTLSDYQTLYRFCYFLIYHPSNCQQWATEPFRLPSLRRGMHWLTMSEAWLSGSDVGLWLADFPDLRQIYGWQMTTLLVNLSAMDKNKLDNDCSRPTRPTQPCIPPGSVNE